MIKLEGIKKSYTVGRSTLEVLKGITLHVEKGEFVSIIGPSGTGKSTLMHIMGLLDTPDSGSYTFMGRDVTNLPDRELSKIRNREIGFVFQAFHLIERYTVIDNVLLPIRYRKEDTKPYKSKALELLERMGILERAHHRASELSGGERQRVAIARALIGNPRLILADEPTGNLDSKTSSEIMDIFSGLNGEGKTVIIVTHDPEVASKCRRIVRMRDGIIESDEGSG